MKATTEVLGQKPMYVVEWDQVLDVDRAGGVHLGTNLVGIYATLTKADDVYHDMCEAFPETEVRLVAIKNAIILDGELIPAKRCELRAARAMTIAEKRKRCTTTAKKVRKTV